MPIKILLVSPPIRFRMASGHLSDAGFDLGATFPPLGLMYLATILNDRGYQAQVTDFAEEGYTPGRLLNAAEGCDLVGFSVLRTNRDAVQKLIDVLHIHDPYLPIICGGPDVSLRPVIFRGSRATVIGESEETILPIVETILSGGDLSKCLGVYYRDSGTGEDILGPIAPLPENLDNIPFPDRSLVERSKYGLFGSHSRGRTAMVITTRGCPFNCSFCSRLAQNRNTYRMRSAENVLAELQRLHDLDYKYLFIGDANFVVDKHRTKAILEGIIERGLHFRIILGCRVDMVNDGLLKLMRRAGVFLISYGFESGTQGMLDFLNKGTTIEQNRYVLEATRKAGIFCHGNFIIGGRDETVDDIRRTISFSRAAGMDAVFFNILSYQYGSKLWKDAYSAGLIAADELNKLAILENGLSSLRERDLRKWHHRALIGFYCRPLYLARLLARGIRAGDISLFRLIIKSTALFMINYLRQSLSRRMPNVRP
jgi:anaerobic magnesium-protoporphyrin IX monomethyl ester cyclase